MSVGYRETTAYNSASELPPETYPCVSDALAIWLIVSHGEHAL